MGGGGGREGRREGEKRQGIAAGNFDKTKRRLEGGTGRNEKLLKLRRCANANRKQLLLPLWIKLGRYFFSANLLAKSSCVVHKY